MSISLVACGSGEYDNYESDIITEEYRGSSTPKDYISESYKSYNSVYDITNGVMADTMSDNAVSGGLGINLDLDFGGSSNKSESAAAPQSPESDQVDSKYEDNENDDSDENVDSTQQINYEKLVYEASISMETKEFDTAITNINDLVKEYKGFIENKDMNNNGYYDDYGNWVITYRNYYLTVRIPTNRFDEFNSAINAFGNVTNYNDKVTNISQRYYNRVAFLESYENQLEVLQDMYNRAETISELIEIEARISEVQGEITSITTEIQSMDMDVAYSTITLNVREVRDYTESYRGTQVRYIDKVKAAFVNGFENFVEFLEDLSIFLIENMYFLAIAAVIIIFIVKKRRKKKMGADKDKSTAARNRLLSKIYRYKHIKDMENSTSENKSE